MQSALAALLILAGVLAPATVERPGNGPMQAVIGLIPDPQNYCSVQDPHLYNAKLAMEMLDAQVADVIALRPDFVLVLGDLTDSSGGSNENLNSDDTSSAGLARDSEWTCFRSHVWTPLRAAGIPVHLITGNHDSCVDFERHFPKAEWNALPYAYSVESGINDCSAGGVENTEQRSAIFETPIGDICVVGADYGRATFATDIDAYVDANIGCGAGLPTIVARHSGAQDAGWMGAAANSEVFMTAEAHFVGSLPFDTMLDFGPFASGGGFQYLRAALNMQEVHLGGNGVLTCPGAGVPEPNGFCMHTGLSWWATVTIQPAIDKATILARAPWFGGSSSSSLPALYTVDGNKSVTFDWCTRFPGGPAC